MASQQLGNARALDVGECLPGDALFKEATLKLKSIRANDPCGMDFEASR